MANDTLVAEPQTTDTTASNTTENLDNARMFLADAMSEPVTRPTKRDTLFSVLGWVLYTAAMLAVLRALWAVGDQVSHTVMR